MGRLELFVTVFPTLVGGLVELAHQGVFCHFIVMSLLLAALGPARWGLITFPSAEVFKKRLQEQGLYSAASQARRVGDKLIAVPLLGADLAFTYNIFAQIASGVVLLFDKAFNIIERLSYLKRQTERIIINRAPFILTSCLAIALASTWQEASNSVTLTLIVLSIFFWSLAIVDRELDYMWWSGQKNVVRLSFFTSIFWGLSLSFCLVIDLHITQLTQLTFSLVIMATMVSMALYMRSQIK